MTMYKLKISQIFSLKMKVSSWSPSADCESMSLFVVTCDSEEQEFLLSLFVSLSKEVELFYSYILRKYGK